MTQLAEKLHPWVADGRPAGGPRWLQDLRERAAATFTSLGFPTVRDEEWRFTNPGPVVSVAYQLADASAVVTPQQADRFVFGQAHHRLVIVNGRFSAELSRLRGLPAGVRAGSLRSYINGELQADAEITQRYL